MFYNQYGFENITPDELNEKLNKDLDFLLLDVRTPQENAIQAISNSYLLPVQELANRAHELPKDKEIVVYCRIGNRSAFASAYLAQLGYKVMNLEGGIVAWNLIGQRTASGPRTYHQ